ncbi:MAG: DNA polymerase III subunit beta [Gammaproteobacteria bacterium]|nr:DNA polymerase III subunit beta [Gammaproteobacteria bacterium]MDH5799570.1 DNA polymerase III subunit beta [Gammaproteobacteria bacterium]
MRFTISRENLFKPLQYIVGVVERRQTMAILSNFLLEAKNQQLVITATDLEIEMVVQTDLDVSEPGKTTLPARKLYEICRALPEQAQIELSVSPEKERALIRSGKSRFNLATLSAEGFPAVEKIDSLQSFSISQKSLKNLIDKTQFAMAQQDVRYYLNGLLLEVDAGQVRCVATDGHRLAFCEYDADVNPDKKIQVILPRKGISELAKMLEESDKKLNVDISENHARISNENWRFTTKLIDGKFPDYERVIPSQCDKLLTADKEELRDALARASILSNEKFKGIRMSIQPNLIQVQAHNPEMEEAEEELDVEYDGAELSIGFNVGYLLDAVSILPSEKVRLGFSDANSSCLITLDEDDFNCKYVVMPMRL